jgi:hypothetical protein
MITVGIERFLPVAEEKRAAAFLFLLFTATWLVRVQYITSYAGSWDAIDFALALDRYDIFSMQPHFPGYPVFIVMAKMVFPFLGDSVRTLSFISASLGSLSILWVYGLARNLTGQPYTSLLAAAFYSWNPLISLTHVQPMSESTGLFFLLLMLYITSISLRHETGKSIHFYVAIWSLIVYGIGMGVRISYFPLVFAVLLPLLRMRPTKHWILKGFLAVFAGILTGLAWILPTARTEGGLLNYMKLGKGFTQGHFYDWGGTPVSEQSSFIQLTERVIQWVWDQFLWAGWIGIEPGNWNGYIIPALIIIFTVAVIAILRIKKTGMKMFSRTYQPIWLFCALCIIPYMIWLLIGQNPEKSRHILPILPFIIMGVAWVLSQGIIKGPRYRLLLGLLIGTYLLNVVFQSVQLMNENQGPSPALEMSHYVKSLYKPGEIVIFTWEEERTFQYYAEGYTAKRVKSFGHFDQLRKEFQNHGRTVLISSKVIEGFAVDHRSYVEEHLLKKEKFEGHSLVFPVYDQLILYEWTDDTGRGSR